jgi:lysyl-tRNA synthetase class 2
LIRVQRNTKVAQNLKLNHEAGLGNKLFSLVSFEPAASLQMIQARAQMLTLIRQYFLSRQIVEVTTPVLAAHTVTDPNIESLSVATHQNEMFLQTSPEFAMKRLLAAGSGPIYQICPAFRAAEEGKLHNPEFTMLEWYRPDTSLSELMDELRLLMETLATSFGVAWSAPKRVNYHQLFQTRFNINPHRASVSELLSIATREFPQRVQHLATTQGAEQLDDVRDLLFSQGIEKTLMSPHFVTGFPMSQAALAKTCEIDGENVALRFEMYWHGLEIANAYDELLDSVELVGRAAKDNQRRKEDSKPMRQLDGRLLSAMDSLPQCAGIAVGIDRLLMCLTNSKSLEEVLTFPFSIA